MNGIISGWHQKIKLFKGRGIMSNLVNERVFDKKYGLGRVTWQSDDGEHIVVTFQPSGEIIGYYADGRERRCLPPTLVFKDDFNSLVKSFFDMWCIKVLTVFEKTANFFSTRTRKQKK